MLFDLYIIKSYFFHLSLILANTYYYFLFVLVILSKGFSIMIILVIKALHSGMTKSKEFSVLPIQ